MGKHSPFSQGLIHMKIIKDIHFNGRITEEILELPCVKEFGKDRKGKPIIIIDNNLTLGRTIARIGDHIMQFETGMWQVFGACAVEKISKGGTY